MGASFGNARTVAGVGIGGLAGAIVQLCDAGHASHWTDRKALVREDLMPHGGTDWARAHLSQAVTRTSACPTSFLIPMHRRGESPVHRSLGKPEDGRQPGTSPAACAST